MSGERAHVAGADALPGAQHRARLFSGRICVPSIQGHRGSALLLAGTCAAVWFAARAVGG